MKKYDEVQILKDYNSNVAIKDIMAKYDIKSIKTIYDIKKREGREHNIPNKKYQVNENYFEKIDTEEKAYWLGFLYADGNVRMHKNRSGILKLKLKQSDKQHIEKFNSSLNSNYPIKDGLEILKYKNREYKCYYSVVCIYNTKMVKDLYNLGCMNNKTFKIKFPEFLDSELIRHFIRGYFDGDGCITSKNKKNGRVSIVSASYDFLIRLNEILINCVSVANNKIGDKKGCYVINWCGLSDVENLHTYFYECSTIYLDRKRKKYNEILLINNSIIKYRKNKQIRYIFLNNRKILWLKHLH